MSIKFEMECIADIQEELLQIKRIKQTFQRVLARKGVSTRNVPFTEYAELIRGLRSRIKRN
jgi:hypothetical protein